MSLLENRIYFLLVHLQQWESLYPPLTFQRELGPVDPAGDTHFNNKLDPTKAFKGRSKVATPKKKQSTQGGPGGSAKGHVSVGKHAVVRRWETLFVYASFFARPLP